MGINAKVICDSISPMGVRLTTLEVTMPRIILAEFNTHRVFSRNSASSRAIPVEKMIERVKEDPFIPLYWGKNQKGMQANEELTRDEEEQARQAWLWHTVIVTATEWSNFFAQRCHPDAMPEMRMTAEAMRDAMEASEPRTLNYGWWHLPYLRSDEIFPNWTTEENIKQVSVARCARVSYLQHDGTRSIEKDLELYERLLSGAHMSPFEHVATPISPYSSAEDGWSGNFRGWHQLRKDIPNENR